MKEIVRTASGWQTSMKWVDQVRDIHMGDLELKSICARYLKNFSRAGKEMLGKLKI